MDNVIKLSDSRKTQNVMTLTEIAESFTADDEQTAAATGARFLEYVCMRCSQETGARVPKRALPPDYPGGGIACLINMDMATEWFDNTLSEGEREKILDDFRLWQVGKSAVDAVILIEPEPKTIKRRDRKMDEGVDSINFYRYLVCLYESEYGQLDVNDDRSGITWNWWESKSEDEQSQIEKNYMGNLIRMKTKAIER